jgi:hypothetical protein
MWNPHTKSGDNRIPKLEVLGLSFVKTGHENKSQNEKRGWGGAGYQTCFLIEIGPHRSFTPSFGFVLAAPSLLAHILHQIKSCQIKILPML